MVFKTRMIEHKREQHKSKGMRLRKGVKDGTLLCVSSHQTMQGLRLNSFSASDNISIRAMHLRKSHRQDRGLTLASAICGTSE